VDRVSTGKPKEEDIVNSETISATIERFTSDPSAAQSAPAVAAHLSDGRAELSAGSFSWFSDLPPALGGGNTAPSPTAYLLGALAGCAVAFIRDTLAPQLGLRIDEVQAVARCSSDLRGLFGMEGALPNLGDIGVDITVVSSEPSDRLNALYQAWLERCPIYLAVVNPNPVHATFTVAQPAAADGNG
jgi:uncharacterized OsmC-like protein